mmetsp:Transcript_21953/g.54909  ORF Transcript_21953/g.54909 Transcript_21953/m.54909 type:complete len:397 (-) Transcript_21953:387-1577(-)
MATCEAESVGLLDFILSSLLYHSTGILERGIDLEAVPRLGWFVEAAHLHGSRWASLPHLCAGLIRHGPDAAELGSGHSNIADLQCASLHEQRHQGARLAIERRLEDGSRCRAVLRGLQVADLRSQGDDLQEVIDVKVLFCAHLDHGYFASPFLGYEPLLGQFLPCLVCVCAWLVDLVDRHNDRHLRRLCVCNRLPCLRHHTIIGGDNEHGNVCDLCAPRPHGGEGLVARGVDEGRFLVPDLHGVRADALGDSASLGSSDAALTDRVEESRLAMVDVPHHRNDSRSRISSGVVLRKDAPVCSHALRRLLVIEQHLDVVLGSNLYHLLAVQSTVDRQGDPPLCEEVGDDPCWILAQLLRHFINGHAVSRENQDTILRLPLVWLFLFDVPAALPLLGSS